MCKNKLTKLILLRHCQAEGNLKRFFQGRIDSDITDTGRLQIAQAAELLSSEPIDVIYTTTLQRARKTADGINIYHEAPLFIDDGLIEIDPGEWEGRYLTDIEREYPEQYYNWRNDPAAFAAPGGETMEDVYNRTSKALMNIVRENKGKTICIVSHGCAIKNMMCFLRGLPVSRIKEVPLGTNTSVNVIGFDDAMKPTIIMDNYTDHLQKTFGERI